MKNRASPRLAIGQLNISGVDPATARQIGPAIQRALGEAAGDGRIAAGDRGAVRLTLEPGADARTIAAAVAKAVGNG